MYILTEIFSTLCVSIYVHDMLKKNKCFKITVHFCLLLFSYILVCSMLVQIEQPHSEIALYSIVWMCHNWTPVEGYLSCSFRLLMKFYYNQLCCNEYPLHTSLIVEWMLRSPIGSEAICICNFDSCWQIVLHRCYTKLYSNSNVWEKFFAHSLMTQCYLTFWLLPIWKMQYSILVWF